MVYSAIAEDICENTNFLGKNSDRAVKQLHLLPGSPKDVFPQEHSVA